MVVNLLLSSALEDRKDRLKKILALAVILQENTTRVTRKLPGGVGGVCRGEGVIR